MGQEKLRERQTYAQLTTTQRGLKGGYSGPGYSGLKLSP